MQHRNQPESSSAAGADQAPSPVSSTGTAAQAHRRKLTLRTRTGGVWTAVGISAAVLVLLLIFILENGQSVKISYLGAHGRLPLGIALLFSAAGGALLTIALGTARMVQLRRLARRRDKASQDLISPTINS
ncbi:MAG: lipopolysaccharide assembly protein LapA domain-containing protein [Actinobacteria bacterium]|nr:lipopolysaccharide assembly protein LapA domain-containing protein [Actinomycetota bacterium]